MSSTFSRRRCTRRATCAARPPRCVDALEQRDDELADEVIAFDDDVDERYVRIEEGIQSLLARQTPVASDLRLVLAILHVNLHLERMADYCVTIAKLSKLVPEVDPSPRFIEGFEEMGSRCEEMTRIAIDAFADRDLAAGRVARRARRAHRPGEPAGGRAILELAGRREMREYGLRMVLVSRRSSGSGTTLSTSASRSYLC